MKPSKWILVLWIASALLISSCGGGVSFRLMTAPTLVSLTLGATTLSPAAGTGVQLSATGRYSDDSLRIVTGVTWTSSNPSVATVDSSGHVTTTHPGTVTITGKVDTTSANITLTVGAAAPQSLSVNPGTITLAPNETQQLTATLQLTDGTTQSVTTQVTWTSNSEVATVSSSGLVTAGSVAAGIAQINAVYPNVPAGTAYVTVLLPANGSLVYFLSSDGHLLNGLSISPLGALVHISSQGLPLSNISASSITAVPKIPNSTPGAPPHLYLGGTDGTSPVIYTYSVDRSSGDVSLTGKSPAVNAVTAIVANPNGKFLYAIEPGTRQFQLDIVQLVPATGLPNRPDGALLYTLANSSPSPAEIKVTFNPTGSTLYIVTRDYDTGSWRIHVLQVNPSTGAPTELQSLEAPLSSGSNRLSFADAGIAVDSHGKFLLIGASDGSLGAIQSSIQAYSIAADGTLTWSGSHPSSQVTTIRSANGYIFVANRFGSTLDVFAIDSAGILTPAGTIAGVTALDLAVDSSAQYIYFLAGSTRFQSYSFNPSSPDASRTTPIGSDVFYQEYDQMAHVPLNE